MGISFILQIRDVPVDIYGGGGGLWFFPEGREFFSHLTGGEFYFFHQAGEGIFFSPGRGRDFFSKNPGDILFQQSNKSWTMSMRI